MSRRIAATVRLIFVLSLLAVANLPGHSNAAEDVKLSHAGLTLNGRLAVAEGKPPADGVMLITHGTLAHNRMELIATLQDLLEERGINSLAINLSLGIDNRTAAMYDCKIPHRHRYLDAVDEIGAWVKWLKGKGVNRVWLLGHSRGGAQTAFYVTEKLDPMVKKVVLMAPATWKQADAAASYEKGNHVALAPLLEKAETLMAAGKGDEIMNHVGLLYCRDAQATAASFVSYYRSDPRRDTPTLLPKFKIPALVMAGSEDQVVTGLPALVKPFADGDHLRLVVVNEANHFFRDFYAEEAADAIATFLGE